MFDAVGTSEADLSDYRPFRDPDFALSTVYVSTLGSDVTGEGTSGNPFASIERAASIIPTGQLTTTVIQLVGAGPYNCPVSINNYNNITLRGSETTEFTRTISSVSSTSTSNGIVFTLGGAALTANQLKGRHLHVTGVLSGSRNIIVGYNTTGNVCSGVMHNRTFLSSVQSSPAGGSVDVITYTQLNLTANTIISGCVNFAMELVRVTGNFTLFANATEKLNAWKCQFQNLNLNAGRAGGIYALSSTIETIGSSTAGLVAIRNGGDFRAGYGSLITDTNAGANNAFISGSSNGIFTIEEGCVFSNLDAKGIELDNMNLSTVSQSALKVIFENWSGAASCAAGYRINKNGGSGTNYNLPEAHGAVLSNYYVDAQANAFVKVAASTSVGTATTTNAVSADGGSSNVALAADGTRIEGGSPSLTGILIPQEEFTVKHNASAANNVGKLSIGLTGQGEPSFIVLSGRSDTPPYSTTSGKIGVPIGLSNINGTITVQESATPPATAVEVFHESFPGQSESGNGYTYGKFFADLNSAVPGTKQILVEDSLGRQFIVYNKTSPATDDRLAPVYIDPTATEDDEILAFDTNVRNDVFFFAQSRGGFIRVLGQDNTYPLLVDVSGPSDANLYYDDGGSGNDVDIVTGMTNSPSEGEGINTTKYVVTTTLYFDETQTDTSLRFYHRLSFAPRTLFVPLAGTDGLFLEAQYDGTASLGVPVYYKSSGFPADFEANLASASNKTFKTSLKRKAYQSSTE